MPTRTLRFLVQTDPTPSGQTTILDQGTWQFNLGRVAAEGMKELLQSCKAGAPMMPLLEALLADGNSGPLVWREDGPGFGWEMKSAWSGIFGRFFARAFLRRQGYTWFRPIRRSYDRVTDDLVVQRALRGEVADWVCASNESESKRGTFIVAEAKARHMVGNLTDLQKLPPSLENAVWQIRNTHVFYRRAGRPRHIRCRTKGFAVLTRWTNEEKRPFRDPILRAVDPETSGERWRQDDARTVSAELSRSHISDLMTGLGFEGLGFVSSPLKRDWDREEALAILESVRRLVTSGEVFEEEREDPRRRADLLKALAKQEREIQLYEPQTRPKTSDVLRREADAPHPIARVLTSPLRGEEFVGSLYGLDGRVTLHAQEVLGHLKTLPAELVRHLVFVGVRVTAAEQAYRGQPVAEWQINDVTLQAAENAGIYPSEDNVIVAPASSMEAVGARSLR